jgi:hypothetical protein
MSQLDTAVYLPFLLYFLIICFFFYVAIISRVIPTIYGIFRARDLFSKKLGYEVYRSSGFIYILKKFFLLKLFTSRANEYYVYLCKKLQK